MPLLQCCRKMRQASQVGRAGAGGLGGGLFGTERKGPPRDSPWGRTRLTCYLKHRLRSPALEASPRSIWRSQIGLCPVPGGSDFLMSFLTRSPLPRAGSRACSSGREPTARSQELRGVSHCDGSTQARELLHCFSQAVGGGAAGTWTCLCCLRCSPVALLPFCSYRT